MENYGTYIIHVPENSHWILKDRIDKNIPVTYVLPVLWKIPKMGIALFTMDRQSIEYACIVKKGFKVTTAEIRITLKNFVRFDSPISTTEIISTYEGKDLPFKKNLARKKVKWKIWKELFNHIKKLRENQRSSLDKLEELVKENVYDGEYENIVSFSRDALSMSLRMSNIGLKDSPNLEIINNQFNEDYLPPVYFDSQLKEENNYGHRPLFQQLENAELLEEQMLNYDLETFSDWKKVSKDIMGKVTFEKGGHHLEVLNINRTKVEHTLGVDFIYYNRRFGSFILIQYKRMKEEGRNWIYRPDESFDKELGRMKNFWKECEDNDDRAKREYYRINSNPFYFKFCERRVIDLSEDKMVRGMYISMDYINTIEADKQSKGIMGGRLFSYDNVQRHFSNTQFIKLVENGWIGSSIKNTEIIYSIIEESLANNKQVILSEYSFSK